MPPSMPPMTSTTATCSSCGTRARRSSPPPVRRASHIIVLAGRPYHVDPEINHGIDQLIIRQRRGGCLRGLRVSCYEQKFQTSVLNQWTYHSRLYAAAKYCTDAARYGPGAAGVLRLRSWTPLPPMRPARSCRRGGKLYTQLKIDEITNLGAVNIRLRSLFAALEERKEDHKD